MDQINEFNLHVRKCFYDYMDHNTTRTKKETIAIIKTKERRSQWSDTSYNILTGKSNCSNGCCYCYMRRIKKNLLGVVDLEDLSMTVDVKKVEKGWRKTQTPKYIMFPSSHDIFEQHIDSYLYVARKILKAGHFLLIVSKPSIGCIKKLVESLDDYKNSIMFRLTITSDQDDILKLWEPNAPSFEERVECLKIIHMAGYRTGVSIEPFLSTNIV